MSKHLTHEEKKQWMIKIRKSLEEKKLSTPTSE